MRQIDRRRKGETKGIQRKTARQRDYRERQIETDIERETGHREKDRHKERDQQRETNRQRKAARQMYNRET